MVGKPVKDFFFGWENKQCRTQIADEKLIHNTSKQRLWIAMPLWAVATSGTC